MATKNSVFDPDDQIIRSEKEAARQAGMSHSTYRRRIADGTGPKRIRITDRVHCTTPRFLREWREANTIEPNTTA
jgi:predicted DNA-binding transcriptional regulator AlpA